MKIRPIQFSKLSDFDEIPNKNIINLRNKEKKSNSFSPLKDVGLNTEKVQNKNVASKNISTDTNQLKHQKIIKLNKKPISLKKSATTGNNTLYSNFFINNFEPFLLMNNEKKQNNRRQMNKNKEKLGKDKTKDINKKSDSVFQQYKDY